MHLHSRYLPRPSASSPPDNRTHPMANPGQVPDLEGFHREIHDMAEQMRIINDNNGRLMQLLTAANLQPPVAPPVPDIERSRHSNRLEDRSQNISTERVRRRRRRAPSPSLRERSSSSESSKTLARARRGRSPHRGIDRRMLPTYSQFTKKETESLKDFVKRFNQAILEVEDPSDKVIIMAMMEGLRPGPLFDSFFKNVPEILSALQSKADKYIAAEELAEAKRRRRGKDDHKRKEPDKRRIDYREETRHKRPDRDPKRSNDRRSRTPPRRPEGYLRKYVVTRPPPNSPERRYGDNRPTAGDIQTIHGGFGSGGCSTSSRKKHARSALRLAEEEIYNLSSSYVGDQTPITFSNDDLRGLHLPHDDALVVSAVIANFNITVWQDFIVVDCPSPYNAILGRPTLGGIKAITSTYHLKLKFPTPMGIGEIKGDQKVNVGDDIEGLRDEVEQLTLADPRETNNTKPLEEVVPISIHPEYPDRHIMISTELTDELRFALINFLKKNSDIFARSQGDVPCIDLEIAMHKLFTNPKHSPLKEYLESPPLLIVPTTGEDLYVYLSISPTAVSAVLIREEDQVQKLIYYVSKVLMGAEARYPRIEKLAYALMIATRKLRHYFQAHPIIVLTDQPLKQILQRPDTSGRLLKWSIELSEFRIEYRPRMAIKAQALADFIVESTHEGTPQPETALPETEISEEPTSEKDLAHWILFVDGSSNQHGCGAGLIIQTPSGEHMEFGIPKVIISDNARQFDNDKFKLFYSDLAISHHFSSPGHPQTNGQVEVTNRTILRNLKVRLERSKSEWAKDLPSILWAYHTTSRIPTGETPYSMVFGTESVIPVEIGMPSFRTSNFNKESNEAELRLNLNLLEERREKAELRQAAYKCQVAKYYNQRVKHRSFLPGDLALRRVTLSTKEPNVGKLGPTWEGPYKVIKVSRLGTYWLEDPNGKALYNPWNADHLTKYYQ
ncbi:hypothetical protein Acr_00g0036800 [Actinidia rufa]|uniref:Integrase catalytic domain-containing protein n=1 Tax=Actinidia rufa TaxID=165716 RepID=A0A7J0DGW5_9ERIC|nr:hypothetical protein Acr_00g0036800 [Actinidia rufa]